MTEMSKDRRASFPPGEQRKFLEKIAGSLTVADMSRVCGYSEHAIRDWRKERFTMPLRVVEKLAKKSRVMLPKTMRIREAYEHTSRAGKLGMAAVVSKYGRIPGDEKYRNAQWRIWWDTKGKFKESRILQAKAVHLPVRNAVLAEFVGIMMGDGGISPYQVTVTLHHIDDLEYSGFVVKLIQELFRESPRVYHLPEKSVNNIVMSRKAVSEYLHTLGLPIGNKIKQQLDIPVWIKSDQKFGMACLRGLVDTDGSIFTHRYRVKGIWYAYKKLSFTSASKLLRVSVYGLFQKLGFHPRMTSADVRLERVDDVARYFSLIGSHNPKHLRRYGNTVG